MKDSMWSFVKPAAAVERYISRLQVPKKMCEWWSEITHQLCPGGTWQQAMPSAAAVSPLARIQPLSEDKADEQEPRASIMQERWRKAAESQRRIAEIREERNGSSCKHEDRDAESCPHQTECHSKTERAEEPRAISGPQSMLNMFKARSNAAIEASGDCSSFTDRKSQL